MDGVQARVEGAQGLAQRRVQGVDRAVSVGGRVQDLAVHRHLDRGFGTELGPLARLHQHREVNQPEGRGVAGLVAPDQQLE